MIDYVRIIINVLVVTTAIVLAWYRGFKYGLKVSSTH